MRSYHSRGLLAVASQLPAILAYPNPFPLAQSKPLRARANPITWGAIGDSWASGVSYGIGGSTDYDSNKDECLRINEAYSVQVNDNKDWLPEGREGDFHFAACSGSKLVNMIHEPYRGHIQMEAVGEHPRVVTMQAGGNDAGFYNVASNCIFHDAEKDYGALFPEDGECKRAIDVAHRYLIDHEPNNLRVDVDATIKEILDKEPARSTPDFKLYLIGYAHFFDERPEATGCNDWSFNLPFRNLGKPQQKLTLELRQQINGLVTDLNNGLKEVAGRYGDKVGYIDVTGGFDDHRFCQAGHSLWDQYFGDKVYLWNWVGSLLIQTGENSFDDLVPTQEQFDKWLKEGRFTDDPAEVSDDEMATINSPRQGASPGSMLRPFHPKKNGHGAIANAIVQRFKDEVKNSIPPPNGPPPPPPPPPQAEKTKAMQAVFMNHIDEGGNANYWSFFQLKPGEVLDFCNVDAVHQDYPDGSKIVNDGSIDNPPMPNGEWSIKVHDEDCKYSSDGKGPGALDCPSFNGNKLDCEVDSKKEGGEGGTSVCEAGLWKDSYHPAVYCAW